MKNRKRILICTRWPVGGIRTYLRYVYREFPSTDYEFVLVIPDVPEARVLAGDLDGSVNDIRFCENSMIGLLRTIIGTIRGMRFDLVHSHGLSVGALAGPICKIAGISHLLTLHDVFTRRQFVGATGLARKVVAKTALQVASNIHVLGDDPKANLQEFFPGVVKRKNCIRIIRSGIEVERFAQAVNPAIRSDCGAAKVSGPQRKKLGFFGRFMAQKGLIYLVKAVEAIADTYGEDFLPEVICFGSGGFKDREMRLIRSRKLEHVFQFRPFEANVAEVMVQMDGIIMPSRWEAVGLVAMESLVCGVPLITSDCIGLREVVRDTPAFTFESEDVDSLVAAIMSWVNDPRKSDFQQFAPIAAKRFDMKRAKIELGQFYQQIIVT